MSNVRPINDPDFPIKFNETENVKKIPPIDKIFDYVRSKNFLAFKAITGSGKTISLPVKFANKGKRVLMTQPRVLNVIDNVPVIDKVLHENNINKDKTVGHITGQGTFTSNTDYITLCTEGSLLAIINQKGFNEALNDINIIILDEVHERTTDLDLIMFYIKENNWISNKNKLIVTSATFDPSKFAKYFNFPHNIAFLEGAKPNYDIEYSQIEQINDWCNFITNKVIDIHTNTELKKWRDILIFISSKFDIDQLINYLNPKIMNDEKLNGLLITSLYRGMTPDEKFNSISKLQELIEKQVKTVADKDPTRRVIIATNIAETGITLPEVKYVIDMGIAKVNYFDPEKNSYNLVPSYISQNVAEQRWGRVGRSNDPDAKGVVYPLYTEEIFNEMNKSPIPAILKNNIDDIILKFLKKSNLEKIKFLDNPNSLNINRSIMNLRKLNLVDKNGEINELGKLVVDLTISPIHGKMLLYSINYGCFDAMLIVICIIELGLNTIIKSSDFKLPILYNDYLSDHVNLWLIYNYYQEHPNSHMFDIEGIVNLENRILQVKNSAMNNNLPFFNNYQADINTTCLAIKRSVLEVIGCQTAKQSKDNNIIYTNDEVKGKLSSSYLFNNRRPMISIYPKIVCYEQIQLKKKSGLEYEFSLITVPF